MPPLDLSRRSPASRPPFSLGWRCLTALLLLVAITSATESAPRDAVELMRSGGHVLLIRHASAPGFGDPETFRLGDCATQRNLDEQGRLQARSIGDWLRSQGIPDARVYSSQWCRCLETAELLQLGAVTELPALNSFFQREQDRAPNLTALRAFVDRQPRDTELLILVTHQVTISALSGHFAPSGHGVLMALQPQGGLTPVGSMAFGH